MKKILSSLLIILAVLFAQFCASQDYNTQKGAAIGAVGGALAGQAIGHNTAATLIGAADGALVGAVAGNAVDQSNAPQRLAQQQAQPPVYSGPPPAPPPVYAGPPAEENPPGPGQWVEVPGSYVNGQWVPPHRAWVPANSAPPGPPPANYPSSGPPQANYPPSGPPPGGAEYAPPPPYAFAGPPDVVPIPGTYAYLVPGIDADIFFYQGYWYRLFGGRWFVAGAYNGPWLFAPVRRVPRVLLTLPPNWRRLALAPGYRPIPHRELLRNWGRWERERHWEHEHR